MNINHQKAKELRINPERVRELVNGIEAQLKEFEDEYHKLQINHEVLNNE